MSRASGQAPLTPACASFPTAALTSSGSATRPSPSTARVADLSKELNVSERHLRRGFGRAIGYGPKTFGRVLRFRHFLDLVEADGYPLGQAAAEAGYADQPHLTRESKDLAGLPPA